MWMSVLSFRVVNMDVLSIYPSIFYRFYRLSLIFWRSWNQSQLILGERLGSPFTVRHSIIGLIQRWVIHIHTPKDNLELPVNLTCFFFGLWEEARAARKRPRRISQISN